MESIRSYQKALSNIDTQRLVDYAVMPSWIMRQVEVDLIMLEITRRIWNGQDEEVI